MESGSLVQSKCPWLIILARFLTFSCFAGLCIQEHIKTNNSPFTFTIQTAGKTSIFLDEPKGVCRWHALALPIWMLHVRWRHEQLTKEFSQIFPNVAPMSLFGISDSSFQNIFHIKNIKFIYFLIILIW